MIRHLAAARPGWEQIDYPRLFLDDPPLNPVEVWPVGAVRWRCLGTYNPQNGPNGGNRTGEHVVLEQDFHHGRFTREAGRALCESPSKRFWDLGADRNRHMVSCKACLRLALAHGIDLTVRPVSICGGDLWQNTLLGRPCTVQILSLAETGMTTPAFRGIFRWEDMSAKPCEITAWTIARCRWTLVHRAGKVVDPVSDGGKGFCHRSYTDPRGS